MNAATDQALEFLVGRIVAEAQREGKPLDDVEISMLGFSEPTASPAEMEAARAFENNYDDKAYESRIAALARNVYERDVSDGRKPEWDRALDDLADEDIYLHVMFEQAGLMKTTNVLVMPDWRILLGLAPAFVCVALAIVVIAAPFARRLVPNDILRLGLCAVLLLIPFVLGRMGKRVH